MFPASGDLTMPPDRTEARCNRRRLICPLPQPPPPHVERPLRPGSVASRENPAAFQKSFASRNDRQRSDTPFAPPPRRSPGHRARAPRQVPPAGVVLHGRLEDPHLRHRQRAVVQVPRRLAVLLGQPDPAEVDLLLQRRPRDEPQRSCPCRFWRWTTYARSAGVARTTGEGVVEGSAGVGRERGGVRRMAGLRRARPAARAGRGGPTARQCPAAPARAVGSPTPLTARLELRYVRYE